MCLVEELSEEEDVGISLDDCLYDAERDGPFLKSRQNSLDGNDAQAAADFALRLQIHNLEAEIARMRLLVPTAQERESVLRMVQKAEQRDEFTHCTASAAEESYVKSQAIVTKAKKINNEI